MVLFLESVARLLSSFNNLIGAYLRRRTMYLSVRLFLRVL